MYSSVTSGFKGLFTWREEGSRRRNNFLFGLNAEISVGVVMQLRRKASRNCRPLPAERPAVVMLVFLSLVLGFSERR